MFHVEQLQSCLFQPITKDLQQTGRSLDYITRAKVESHLIHY